MSSPWINPRSVMWYLDRQGCLCYFDLVASEAKESHRAIDAVAPTLFQVSGR